MLITPEYREQLILKHRVHKTWGNSGNKMAGLIKRLVGDCAPKNILDYGCGKQSLAQALPEYRIKGYDPAMPGIDQPPEPHDLVVCCDVLEHIEPDCLDDVLDDLARVTKKTLFVYICVLPAIQFLPDGRNAHLIVESPEWWVRKMMEKFTLQNFATSEVFTQIICGVKSKMNGVPYSVIANEVLDRLSPPKTRVKESPFS